eukprot:m.139627 g.139627  ORF g.139627 m.139627 type:complete len:1132 (-) comp16092_c0_seq1:56-3451(-)
MATTLELDTSLNCIRVCDLTKLRFGSWPNPTISHLPTFLNDGCAAFLEISGLEQSCLWLYRDDDVAWPTGLGQPSSQGYVTELTEEALQVRACRSLMDRLYWRLSREGYTRLGSSFLPPPTGDMSCFRLEALYTGRLLMASVTVLACNLLSLPLEPMETSVSTVVLSPTGQTGYIKTDFVPLSPSLRETWQSYVGALPDPMGAYSCEIMLSDDSTVLVPRCQVFLADSSFAESNTWWTQPSARQRRGLRNRSHLVANAVGLHDPRQALKLSPLLRQAHRSVSLTTIKTRATPSRIIEHNPKQKRSSYHSLGGRNYSSARSSASAPSGRRARPNSAKGLGATTPKTPGGTTRRKSPAVTGPATGPPTTGVLHSAGSNLLPPSSVPRAGNATLDGLEPIASLPPQPINQNTDAASVIPAPTNVPLLTALEPPLHPLTQPVTHPATSAIEQQTDPGAPPAKQPKLEHDVVVPAPALAVTPRAAYPVLPAMAVLAWQDIVPKLYAAVDYHKPTPRLVLPAFVSDEAKASAALMSDEEVRIIPKPALLPAQGYVHPLTVLRPRSPYPPPLTYASIGLPSLDILSSATPSATPLLSPSQALDRSTSPSLVTNTAAWLSRACSQSEDTVVPATTAVNSPAQTLIAHMASACPSLAVHALHLTDIAHHVSPCTTPHVRVKACDEHTNWKLHPAALPLLPLLQYRPLHGPAHRILFLVTNLTDMTKLHHLTTALSELQHTYRHHGYGRLTLPSQVTTIALGDHPGATPLDQLPHSLRARLNDHGSNGHNEEGNLVLVAFEHAHAHDAAAQAEALQACQHGVPERLALVTTSMRLPQALLRGTWQESNLARFASRIYQSLGRPPVKPSAPNAACLPLRNFILAPAQHDVSTLEAHGTELRFQARLHVLHCAIAANIGDTPFHSPQAVLCFTDAHGELLETVAVDASAGASPADQWSIVANSCWQHTQHIVRQTSLHWHLAIALSHWSSAADVAIKQAHLLDEFACEDYSVLSVNVLSLVLEEDVRLPATFVRRCPSGVAVLSGSWQRLAAGLGTEQCLQAMAWSQAAVVQFKLHWRLCTAGIQGHYALEQKDLDALLYLAQAYYSLSHLQVSQGLTPTTPFEPLHLSLARHRLDALRLSTL